MEKIRYTTADGVSVTFGDRVYNYYDLEWGVIVRPSSFLDWFEFQPTGATQTKALNGERVSFHKPSWA